MELTDELLAEIFKIVEQPVVKTPLGPRAYYELDTKEIICFSDSLDEMDKPYISISREILASGATDIWCIEDGKIVKREEYYQDRIRLRKGSTYATIKDDMQFAVTADWSGDKDFWDVNN